MSLGFNKAEINILDVSLIVVRLKDDIADGERLDEISVTVLEAEKYTSSSLAWRLSVKDNEGQEFAVKIWHTHDVDTWWREGQQYLLRNGRGKRRSDSEVLLHSTGDFTVHRPEGVVDLLAIGDSHIGRENRPKDSGDPYHTARQFVAAIGYAVRYDVDAVIHAGDLFDDNPNMEDLAIAKSGFDILGKNEIPFYFVYGNHGVDTAEEFYDEIESADISHLGTRGVRFKSTLEVFGLDNGSEEDLNTVTPDFIPSPEIDRHILVGHTEIKPPRESGSIAVEMLYTLSPVKFDYVLSGHLHDPESGTYSETEIQHLGSTADISANQNAKDQSAWLIHVTTNDVDISRLNLN